MCSFIPNTIILEFYFHLFSLHTIPKLAPLCLIFLQDPPYFLTMYSLFPLNFHSIDCTFFCLACVPSFISYIAFSKCMLKIIDDKSHQCSCLSDLSMYCYFFYIYIAICSLYKFHVICLSLNLTLISFRISTIQNNFIKCFFYIYKCIYIYKCKLIYFQYHVFNAKFLSKYVFLVTVFI